MMRFNQLYASIQKFDRTLTWITPCVARGATMHSISPELRSSSTPIFGVAGYRFTFTHELRFAYTWLSIFHLLSTIFPSFQ